MRGHAIQCSAQLKAYELFLDFAILLYFSPLCGLQIVESEITGKGEHYHL